MGLWKMVPLAALLAAFVCGCGRKGPNTPDPVPVSGTVTLDGKPLAHATVFFRPEGDKMGTGSTAVTDSSGHYELVTRYGEQTRKGAVPGKYRVYFSQMVGPDGKPVTLDADKPPADVGARESLPLHLSDPQQTQETAQVGESGGTIDFKLSKRKKAGVGGLMPR